MPSTAMFDLWTCKLCSEMRLSRCGANLWNENFPIVDKEEDGTAPEVLRTRRCHPCRDAGFLLTNSFVPKSFSKGRDCRVGFRSWPRGEDRKRESEAKLRTCLLASHKE